MNFNQKLQEENELWRCIAFVDETRQTPLRCDLLGPRSERGLLSLTLTIQVVMLGVSSSLE